MDWIELVVKVVEMVGVWVREKREYRTQSVQFCHALFERERGLLA